MFKKVLASLMAAALLCSSAAFASESNTRGGRGGQGGAGGTAALSDEQQAVVDENSTKFIQDTFTDPDTGTELEYSLYVPENADDGDALPLLMYIPDSTASGLSALQIVQNYYGADVWVTDEDQAKHPCYVVVPAFSETVVDDDWNTSDQIDTAVKLLEYLQETYNIDADRLYTTGQSMGCMTSLYLNSIYPDMFAASLYVSGQWDISVLQPLEDQKFIYITAGGDTKASGGQDEVMAMFDEDGVSYTWGTWSAQDDADTQNATAQAQLDEGLSANMIRFETGTVLNGGTGMEHMSSFNYAYQITALRDWLFEQ